MTAFNWPMALIALILGVISIIQIHQNWKLHHYDDRPYLKVMALGLALPAVIAVVTGLIWMMLNLNPEPAAQAIPLISLLTGIISMIIGLQSERILQDALHRAARPQRGFIMENTDD